MCDEFADRIQVLDPLFQDFGARRRFSGEVVTVKCFEDNTVVKQTLAESLGRIRKGALKRKKSMV